MDSLISLKLLKLYCDLPFAVIYLLFHSIIYSNISLAGGGDTLKFWSCIAFIVWNNLLAISNYRRSLVTSSRLLVVFSLIPVIDPLNMILEIAKSRIMLILKMMK